MPIKTAMLGLATALMLAASPAAIAAAQDALPSGPPDAGPAAQRLQLAQEEATPDDIRRKQRRPAAEAPQPGEDQPARPRKPRPEAAEGGADAQPEQRPRKPRPAAEQAPDAGQPEQPARRQRPQPAAETPPDQGEPDQQRPRKPRPAAEGGPDAGQPAEQPPRRRPQPAAEGVPDQQQPDSQRPRKPQPAAEASPDAGQPDQQPRRRRPEPGADGQPAPVQQAEPDQTPRRRPPANQADDSQRAPPQAEPAPPAAAGDLPRDDRPAASLSDDELRARMVRIQQGMKDNRLDAIQRAQLRAQYENDRKETLARRARAASGQPAAPDQAQRPPLPGQPGVPRPGGPNPGAPNPVVENPQVDANAERRAAALIGDATPASQLGNAALRGRVMLYRDALSAGNLSPQTQARLRQRLREDSNALRTRIAQQEAQPPQQPAQTGGRRPPVDLPPPLVVQRPGAQDIPGILADRRQSRDLDERGLNRRILVYRDAANDPRYTEEERGYYRRYLDTDREELRRRMIEDRRRRYQDLQWQRDNRQLDVDIDVDLRPPEPSRPPAPVIWAAEADDAMIEDQLIARPLRPLPQRYPRQVIMTQPEVVLAQPEVRAAIPSVELDTIHFGFNEDFMREEEITNLDRIGRIIEKIVIAHPNEVFLIEGHTDAVGSDQANLDLSRRRAEAVKQSLTQYYQISPENLTTAGLGERYLKVQTPDPEEENRRVTIRRVTSLVQN